MADRPKPPTEEEYIKAALDTAVSFAPAISPCKKCGWPVAKGYICFYCNDPNPYNTDADDAAFEASCKK